MYDMMLLLLKFLYQNWTKSLNGGNAEVISGGINFNDIDTVNEILQFDWVGGLSFNTPEMLYNLIIIEL